MFAAMIFIHQQGGDSGEVFEGVVYGDADSVLLAIAKDTREGREVDAVGQQVQGLHAGDGDPEAGIDATGVNPRKDWRHAGGFAVDADVYLAEGGVTAEAYLACRVVGQAEEPLLLFVLALREHVDISALDIRWQ